MNAFREVFFMRILCQRERVRLPDKRESYIPTGAILDKTAARIYRSSKKC